MKHISLVILVSLLLGACSKQTPEKASVKPVPPASEEIVSEIRNISIISNNETETEVVSFGSFSSEANTKTVRLNIANSSGAAIALGNLKALIEAWDDGTPNPNSITVKEPTGSSSCSNKSLGKTKSCYLDITATYNLGLDDNILIVPLRGTDPLVSPTVQLIFDVSESYLQNEALITSGTALVKSTEVLSFGVLTPGASATRRLYISNISNSPIAAPAVPALPTGLSVVRNTCLGSIAKVTSCFMDFKYDYQSENLDSVVSFDSTQMNANQKTLQVSAINRQDNVEGDEPKLSIVLENFPASTTAGSVHIRRIKVTNLSNLSTYTFGADEIASTVTDPSFTILRNTCDGYVLGANKGCYVDLQHKPTVNNQSALLVINLPNANVSQNIQSGPAAVACTPANSGISNATAVSGMTPSCSLVSCSPNYDVTGNTCVAQACSVSDFPNAATVSGDKVLGCLVQTCIPNYTASGNTCAPSLCQASDIANSATVSGDKVSGCLVAACQAGFSQVGNACESSNLSRMCQAQPANSAGGTEVSADAGQTWSACVGFSCNENYSVDGASCSPSSCQASDIANSATVSGDKVTGCLVASCQVGFSQVGNTCLTSDVTRVCEVQPGNSTSGLESSTDAGQTWSACVGYVCNENYVDENNSCVPALCSVSDFPGASAVSGDKINGCIVDSCTDSYYQEVQNNACKDKTPDGTISFNSDYTTSFSGIVMTTNSPYAKQIQFYEDASCSIPKGSVQEISGSTFREVSDSEGVKNEYAKFINGQATSSCLTDSILFDKTGPSMSISSPVISQQMSTNSFIVSGTCVDALSGVNSQVRISTDYGLVFADCLGGIYSATLDITNDAAGMLNLTVMASDSAGNQGQVSIIIEKLAPPSDDEIEPNYLSFALSGITFVDKSSLSVFIFDENHEGVELKPEFQGYSGFINPNGTTLTKLDDGEIYVTRGIWSYNSANVLESNNRVYKIVPDQRFVQEVLYEPTGYNGTYKYFPIISKYLYAAGPTGLVLKAQDLSGQSVTVGTFTSSLSLFNSMAMAFENKVFFIAENNKLYSLDVNGVLTMEAHFSTINAVTQMHELRGKLYFVGNDGSGLKLWSYNSTTKTISATPHNTATITTLGSPNGMIFKNALHTDSLQQVLMYSCNSRLVGETSAYSELCIFDGTQINVININTTANLGSNPSSFIEGAGGIVIFRATVPTVSTTQGGVELVRYTPSTSTPMNASQFSIKDVNGTQLASNPSSFAFGKGINGLPNGFLYFQDSATMSTTIKMMNVSNLTITSIPKPAYVDASNWMYVLNSKIFTGCNIDGYTHLCEINTANGNSFRRFKMAASQSSVVGSGIASRGFSIKGDYLYFLSGQETESFAQKVYRINYTLLDDYPVLVNDSPTAIKYANEATMLNWVGHDLFALIPDRSEINFQQGIGYRDLFKYSPGGSTTWENQNVVLDNYIQANQITNVKNMNAFNPTINASISFKDRIYMSVDLDDGNGTELAYWDGNQFIKFDLNPGVAASSFPSNFYVIKMKDPNTQVEKEVLFFRATGSVNEGAELWMHDGVGAPVMLKDLTPGTDNSTIGAMVSYKGKAVFTATTTTQGTELWITDGTTAGTQIIQDKVAGTGSLLNSSTLLYSFNSIAGNSTTAKVCFIGAEAATGTELFCYNGTSIYLVKDISSTPSANGLTTNQPLILYNNKVYFRGQSNLADSSTVRMWASNGEVDNASIVSSLVPSGTASIPDISKKLGDSIYFACIGSSRSLCKINDSGISFIDVFPNNANDYVTNFMKFNNKIYYTQQDLESTNDPQSLLYRLYSIDLLGNRAPVLINGQKIGTNGDTLKFALEKE